MSGRRGGRMACRGHVPCARCFIRICSCSGSAANLRHQKEMIMLRCPSVTVVATKRSVCNRFTVFEARTRRQPFSCIMKLHSTDTCEGPSAGLKRHHNRSTSDQWAGACSPSGVSSISETRSAKAPHMAAAPILLNKSLARRTTLPPRLHYVPHRLPVDVLLARLPILESMRCFARRARLPATGRAGHRCRHGCLCSEERRAGWRSTVDAAQRAKFNALS